MKSKGYKFFSRISCWNLRCEITDVIIDFSTVLSRVGFQKHDLILSVIIM